MTSKNPTTLTWHVGNNIAHSSCGTSADDLLFHGDVWWSDHHQKTLGLSIASDVPF